MGIASDDDIAQELGWAINRVTPRRNELQKYGFVSFHGLKMGRFGLPVKTYHCTDPNDKRLNRGE